MAFGSARGQLWRLISCVLLLGLAPAATSAQAAAPPAAAEKEAAEKEAAAKKGLDAKPIDKTPSADEIALLKEKERARLAQLAKDKAAKDKLAKAAADKAAADKAATEKLASGVQSAPDPLSAGARRISVGEMSPDSQIAVRGSLIVTATAASKDGKTPGGVRVLRGSASSIEVLFFAPSPAGFVASGVALVEDSIFYVLNSSANKPSVLVNLGLDGGYRWSRELDGPAQSLPLVQTGERGVALAVWVLVGGAKQLRLEAHDATTGLPGAAHEVPACPATGKAQLYYLRQDEPSSFAVWCPSSTEKTGAGQLVYMPPGQPSLQVAIPSPFASPPSLALVEASKEAWSESQAAPPPEWVFAGWTPGTPVQAGGTAQGASLRCDFRKRPKPCESVSSHAWGRDDYPGSFGFSLHDDATDTWIRWSIANSGFTTYRGFGGKTEYFQLDRPPGSDFEHLSSASLGNVDGDDDWELIVAGGGELGIFDTTTDSPALDRFPRGDLALSGVTPTWLQDSSADAVQPGIDEETLVGSSARNGAGGGFLLEALTQWRNPAPKLGASNRTLFGLGKLDAVVFQPESRSEVAGPVGEHRLASAAEGRWYFADVDAVKVAEPQSDGTLVVSRIWPAADKTAVVTGFDAAGDSVAITTKTEALWCNAPAGASAMKCEVVASDSSLGPVALSPDGHTYWLGMSDGSVHRWYRANATSVRSELRGVAAAKGELHLLRAFDSLLYVGREATVDSYSVGSVPEKRQSYRFHADAIERCDGNRAYALNDGQLVYASGDSDFEVVQDQPALIRAIACDAQGDLIGVSNRFGAFRLRSPPGWPWQTLLVCLGVVALPALGLLFFGPLREQQRRFSGRSRAGDGKPIGVLDHVVSHILDADSPKETFEAGTHGQQALVGALRDFIDNEATVPPLTIGVYGAWGSGKSSVMRILDGQLQKTGRYVTVWFNAWRHHQESQLGPALLQNIVREFRRQAGPRMRFYSLLSALRDSRRTFYWGAAALTLALPSVAGYLVSNDKRALVGLLGSIVPFWKSVFTPVVRLFSMEPAEAANKSFSERIDFLQEFSEEFERVVGSLPKNHYLAIFVDDLDRCPPNRVANVLEALNRLMESRLCFVVLGMDPDTVRRCVEMRYEKLIASLAKDGSARAANFGEQFLEKLVGMAVSVPPVPAEELEAKQVEDENARAVQVPRSQQLSALLKDLGAGLLSRIDQVLVTAALVAAVATAFLCWRQDPRRVEGWVQTAITLDQSAEGEGPGAAPSAAPPRKEGQEGLPHVEDETPAKPAAVTSKPELTPGSSNEPPGSKAKAKTKTSPSTPLPAASAIELTRVLGAPPAPVEATEVARVTQPHAEPLSREYETAANFNRVLMLGVGVVAALGALLLGAMLWREIQIEHRAPPRKDSEAFAQALKKASARFQNPRQRVRYRNLARLTYHLVAKACEGKTNWEGTFFELLSAHVLGEDYVPSPEHAWVQLELTRWLDRVARAAGPAAQPRNGSAPPEDTSGTVRTAGRQSISQPPTDGERVQASRTEPEALERSGS